MLTNQQLYAMIGAVQKTELPWRMCEGDAPPGVPDGGKMEEVER
jgi:hypothetical protein